MAEEKVDSDPPGRFFLTGLGNAFVEIESGLTDDDVRLRFNQEMCHSYNDIEGPGQKGDFSDFLCMRLTHMPPPLPIVM